MFAAEQRREQQLSTKPCPPMARSPENGLCLGFDVCSANRNNNAGCKAKKEYYADKNVKDVPGA